MILVREKKKLMGKKEPEGKSGRIQNAVGSRATYKIPSHSLSLSLPRSLMNLFLLSARISGVCLLFGVRVCAINSTNNLNCSLLLMRHCYNLIYILRQAFSPSISLFPSLFPFHSRPNSFFALDITMCCACMIVTNANIFFF